MKDMNEKAIFKNAYFHTGIALIAGLILGWLVFGKPDTRREQTVHSEAEVWICSMHPQIRQDKPGKCPLCAMDLTPLKKTSPGAADSAGPDVILLSEEAAALAGIQTTPVRRSDAAVKEIRLYGTVQPNERLVHSQVAHINGRIEHLSVNFTGETVRQGQVIATLYSPDLQNAQQELLEAARLKDSHPELLEAAREKLRRLKLLSDAQIAAAGQSDSILPLADITADTGGTVIARNVSQGDYVSPGSILFSVADLSSVWIVFDAYEADLPYLRTGETVTCTLPALPGETLSGKIAFIDPVLDETTRTAGVRVETANAGRRLKPGMYAGAVVRVPLREGEITIPGSAVLWTGKRSVVYVRDAVRDIPAYEMREVELGAALGDSYVILSGLDEGEEIVTNGAFTVDATAQLDGKRSMMNAVASTSVRSEHAMISVQGLCGMCKERIENAAKSVDGVLSASWDAETLLLHLDFYPSETNEDEIGKAVAKAGHDTDKYKADDSTYGALPGCCKYRK
jgi:Cu(I)/Ag(I) efflux system membrane fusion protein